MFYNNKILLTLWRLKWIHSVSYREITAVYCKNHIAHKNNLCGQNVQFLLSKPVAHIAATKSYTVNKHA
jgi:hypothetical protein